MKRRTSQSTNTEIRLRAVSLSPERLVIQLMEERVTDSEEERDEFDELQDKLLTPRHRELLKQKIKLTNGAEMEIGTALGILDILRWIQENEPDQLQALVALGRPKEAAPDLPAIGDAAKSELVRRRHIRADGTLRPEMATVLDAAYKETKEGVVLVDPIVYPNQEMANELSKFEDNALLKLGQVAREYAKRNKKNDKEGGQSP